MTFELTHPLLLFALILLIVIGWAYYRSLLDFSTWQRIFSLIVRTVILVLVILSLAGLTVMYPTHERMVVFLVDQSKSIDEAAQKITDEFLAPLRNDEVKRPHAIIPFATTPQLPVMQNGNNDDRKNTEQPKIDLRWKNGTNISAALEPAIAMVPPQYVPHIVVISDGNETSGDFLTTAIRSGVVISTVALPASDVPEVQLSEIRMPPQIRQGEPFYVEVVIQSNRKTEARIAINRGDFKVLEENKSLEVGENIFRFKQTLENQRQVEFSAVVAAKDDTIIDNNMAEGLVYVGGKPRVLLIDDDPKVMRDLVSALREQEIEIEVRPSEGVPKTLDELENYEAVMISNLPASKLTMRQMDLIRSYVSDLGGGLIMLGGEQSFGLGGYYKTPIEEILPVRSDFEKEKEKPSIAMCLVIDRSGSMGGEPIELAKDAAKSAVELLSSRDYASVIAFDSTSYVVCPMQSASAKGAINSAIATIESGGGTNIYPGLVDAYDQLNRVTAKIKHVILLTDGVSEPGDFEGITRKLVNAQVTVSTVGVGNGADNAVLENLAKIGQGRHYTCDDPQSIPQIFARETVAAGSKSAIHELPFVPVVITPTSVLANVGVENAPPLLGFVVTRPKATSQVILATESGDPLLTWWRHGLGMSVAFTSDAKSRWAAEWLTWPEFSTFWAQIIRHTMRKSDSRGTMIELAKEDGRVHLTLDAVDDNYHYITQATGKTTVIRPNLAKEEIDLVATAPGRFEGDLPVGDRGGYHLQMTLHSGEKTIASQSRGIIVGYPDELRLKPTNTDLLERVAASTGGTLNPLFATLFEPDMTHTAWRTDALWPYLLATAACLFVLDVLLRRIDFSGNERKKSS